MKSLIYYFTIIAFIVISATNALAQCDPVGITTHPDNAVNPEKPTKTNTFDWRTTIFDVNSSYIPNPYIVSPFFQDDNTGTLIFADNPDRLPEDGWELIRYKNGYNLDGSIDQTFDGFAYLVLYNKYTGVLRVMTVGDQTVPYTGAIIKISFDGFGSEKQTSLLSNASNIFALDQFEAAPEINAAMQYSNNAARWFFADFQMTYDPCTCLFESILKIEVDLIEHSSIELTGSLSGTITSIDNKAGSVSQKAQGFSFKELGSAAAPAVQKAQKTYASANKFVTTQFEALNTEGKTEAQLIAEGKLELANKVRSLNQFQSLLKKSDFLQQGLKAVPYIGAAVELIDFFVSGGKKAPSAQEVKIMPMSIQADMRLDGYITTSYPFLDITVNTPGSENVVTRNNSYYPLYNEVLGVFNLLETPVVKYEEEYDYVEEDFFDEEIWYAQYQLEPLKYVINPAAGFNLAESEILVSLDFGSFSTAYVPISTVNSFSVVSGFSSINGSYDVTGCSDENPRYVRLLLNLKRNGADANTQNVLMALRYPVNLVEDNSFSFNPSYCRWQENLSFQNQTISGTHKAWDNITIGQGTVMQPGTVIQAGSITVEKGVTIPQGVTLKLGLPSGAVDTGISIASVATVTTFCNGATYNDPQRQIFARKSEVEPVEEVPEIKKEMLFAIYPNPTQGIFTLDVGNSTLENVEIVVLNTQGSIVYSEMKKKLVSKTIDLSLLPKGIYLVKIENSEIKETIRLVLN